MLSYLYLIEHNQFLYSFISRYEALMRTQVYNQLEVAQLGGIPGMVSLVRAYLNTILPPHAHTHLEDGISHGAPVWPLIFFCLRAGSLKAACLAASENK